MIRNLFRKYKFIFVSAIIVTYILYSSILNFDLWNPDSLNRSVYIKDLIWVQQMRWANQLWETFVRSYFIFPELTLFLNCIFMASIVILILDIFEINGVATQILIMVCVVASVHQVSNMTYAYCGDEFTIAYFGAVLGAWFLSKLWTNAERRGRFIFWSGICFVISLAMYQPYFSIGIMLVALKFVFELMGKIEVEKCFKKVLVQVAVLIGSLLSYIISVYIALWAYNTTLSSYRGMDKLSFSFEKLVKSIIDAYKYIYFYYFTDSLYNNSFRYRKELHVLILIMVGVVFLALLYQCKQNLNIAKIFLIVITICVFPIAFNFVRLLTNTGISFMMLPVIPYYYIIGLIIMDKLFGNGKHTVLSRMCYIPMGLAAWTSILVVLITISELKLDISKVKSIATNLDYAIKSEKSYTLDTPVLVVGNYEKGLYPDVYGDVFNSILGGTVHDFGQFWQGEGMGMTTFNNWNHIFMRYCGSQYAWCTEEQYNYIISSSELQKMDIFPKAESIQYINNVLVVKLSDSLY